MLSRWWKEQLKKRNREEKKAVNEASGSLSDESTASATAGDLSLTIKPGRKRKRKQDISKATSEDGSLNPSKKKKKDISKVTVSDSKRLKTVADSTTDSATKKKYVLFIGEFNVRV